MGLGKCVSGLKHGDMLGIWTWNLRGAFFHTKIPAKLVQYPYIPLKLIYGYFWMLYMQNEFDHVFITDALFWICLKSPFPPPAEHKLGTIETCRSRHDTVTGEIRNRVAPFLRATFFWFSFWKGVPCAKTLKCDGKWWLKKEISSKIIMLHIYVSLCINMDVRMFFWRNVNTSKKDSFYPY